MVPKIGDIIQVNSEAFDDKTRIDIALAGDGLIIPAIDSMDKQLLQVIDVIPLPTGGEFGPDTTIAPAYKITFDWPLIKSKYSLNIVSSQGWPESPWIGVKIPLFKSCNESKEVSWTPALLRNANQVSGANFCACCGSPLVRPTQMIAFCRKCEG